MRQCSVKLNKRECVNKCKRANKGQKQICSVFQNVSQSIKEHAHIAFPGVTVNISGIFLRKLLSWHCKVWIASC